MKEFTQRGANCFFEESVPGAKGDKYKNDRVASPEMSPSQNSGAQLLETNDVVS